MSYIVENFEQKANFKDESEAELIREKLEILVSNILTQVEKRDSRFHSTFVKSGSVYEGTKVCEPDEFDFMIRVNSLTNTPFLHPCNKGDGYVKLSLESREWEDFKDADGFFSPNLLSRFFKRLVSKSLDDIKVPEGLAVFRTRPSLSKETWWPVFTDPLGNSGEESQSGAMYSENHGPATTLYVQWQGGSSYQDLKISVDLTLSIDYPISKLPVPLVEIPLVEANSILQRWGFHVVPAGFDSWRVSFSMVEKEVLATSPDGLKQSYQVLKIVRDIVSKKLGWDPSLVPSYVFKSVLLSQLFTNGHRWEKELRSQTIIELLERVM
ncbi:cyclic GMP-AMP synthase-like receptor [Porites lutea]|uniref:cyclic GMP-AMP synthase-like receptor n=1 Tax=Porites lutea TaxID=51062 RepID=UPI003CC5C6FE